MNIKKQLLNLKKPFIILLSFFLVFCCFGCTQSNDASSAQHKMKQKLKEKYGINVTIDKLKEEPGMQALQEGYFTAMAAEKEKGYYFNVYLGKLTDTFKDDYAKFLYYSQIKDIVDNVVAQHTQTGIPFSDYSMLYNMTEKTFTNEDQLNEYLDDRLAIASFKIDVENPDAEMAENIYYFASDLKANHIPFELEIHKRGKNIYFTNVDSSANDTKKMYIQKMTE